MQAPSNARLILLSSEDPTLPSSYPVTEAKVVIGREEDCEIVIPSQAISRKHTRISYQDNAFTIEDLGSSNGTFVNGAPISGPTPLRNGDTIGLGQAVQLRFEWTLSGASQRRQAATSSVPSAATVLDQEIDVAGLSATPPQLTVAVAGMDPRTHLLTRDVISIGRADDNDIVIPSQIVSRYHARLERTAGGYILAPSAEAGNPILFEGRPLEGNRFLQHEDLIRIGSMDPGMMVTMTYTSQAQASAAGEAINIDFGASNVLSIGRDPENDIVLDMPQVSRFHGQIEKVGARFRLRDLGSINGTFVNDQRIEGEVWLNVNDAVRIGSFRFVLGEDEIAQIDESGSLRVDVIGLNKWVSKVLNILQDISLVLQPREFVVVVGQSGGGKSTLVNAVSGYKPATHGRVLVNDIDVYKNFDAVRNEIGFVPQKDIIHMELTVYQAIDYAAQLRMPPDTTARERQQRVMEVLADLDLTHRKDVEISGLSGGQQKRVSIGVELLTKPSLFFLDEPTSGLDPGTETALMQLMRRLADQGRTIILITHATKNVMLADKVVFLARGGYLAWFGPPDEALHYFDPYRPERQRRDRGMEFDEIYAILDNPANGSAAEWAERYRQHVAYRNHVLTPLADKGQSPNGKGAVTASSKGATTGRKQVSGLRQLMILISRNIKIITRDRASLTLMLAAAPLVSLLDVILAILLGRTPFAHDGGNSSNSIITLFILPLYGIMVGGLATMREIVKESEIYKRERLVNLKIFPYALSKVWIALILALYQAGAYVLIRYIAFQMPGGIIELVLIYITMVVATFAGMMLGLFSSALAPNANAAPLIVILFILPQIVLGGALIPLPPAASAPISSRWGFEGLMSIVGIGSDVAADVCWDLPPATRDSLTNEEKVDLGCRCLGPNLFDEESCSFPGMRAFYRAAVDSPPPAEPPPAPVEPARPELPEKPIEPEDQSDNVAMAQYFSDLEDWQDQVTAIQSSYEADLGVYRAELDVYQAQVIEYQTSNAEYQTARATAIQPAEGVIRNVHNNFGWTFVNKEDPLAFIGKVASTWLAQLVISTILFIGILILQKRKDEG